MPITVLALLYDIHGNLTALEAVLADADAAGASSFVLGGDYALFGPRPAETVERLRQLDAQWIRGNCDRWLQHPPDDPAPRAAVEECVGELGPDTAAELAALPETISEQGTAFWHASPVSDMHSFFPEPAEDEAELLAGVTEPRLVFGHTHLAFRRASVPAGIELINPGSVGMPLDGNPRAAYALMHDDGSIESRRVEYEHGGAANALRQRFRGDWVEGIARRFESARLA